MKDRTEGGVQVSFSSARGASEDVVKALDPQVTGGDLLRLAVHREPPVRAAVASRHDCPAGALISLGHDHSVEVLEALIANPRTPSSVIRNLADSRNEKISGAAVQRLRNSYR
ncbi:hypothetical protein ACNI3K_04285 [Demequina sp. SO4-13]|uniref:hypothetical protein n=1 Tax=Demequina sp. SO4-13 TaxID=3401027 RepID=UPI003AF73ECF